MTWSPFATLVTPRPTSTTTPARSWPRIAGKRPSGSAPERVNSSVWQMPVALISTSASPAFGPCNCTVSILNAAPALWATAARTSMCHSFHWPGDGEPMHLAIERIAAHAELAREVAQVALRELELAQQHLTLRSAERVERERLGRRRLGCGGRRIKAVVRRQVADVQLVARAPHDHRAQRVSQLPHVSRPAVRAEELDERLAERNRRRVGRLVLERTHDERALVLALAQGRQRQHESLQPVEQVGAELAAAHFVLQAAGRGGNQAQVYRHRDLALVRRHFAPLEELQQPRLQRRGQLADLVQEKRAALGGRDCVLQRRR